MKITEETIKQLASKELSVKEHGKILESIHEQVGVIWKDICKLSGLKFTWWAFGNDIEYARGDGSSGGEFDPKLYNKFIDITGDVKYYSNIKYMYYDGFPTSFLWTDYKDIVIKHLEKIDKPKPAKIKTSKIMMEDSIKSKLTKTEWNYVKGFLK